MRTQSPAAGLGALIMLELFETPLTVLHIFVCFFLILVVLIQPGKSGGLGAALGGAGATQVFGGRGAGNFLSRATWICAGTFFVTSMVLAYISSSADDSLENHAAAATVSPAGDKAAEADAVAGDKAASEPAKPADLPAPIENAPPEPAQASELSADEAAAGGAPAVAPVAGTGTPIPATGATKPVAPVAGEPKLTPPAVATAVAPRPPVNTAPVRPSLVKPAAPTAPVSPVKPAVPPVTLAKPITSPPVVPKPATAPAVPPAPAP